MIGEIFCHPVTIRNQNIDDIEAWLKERNIEVWPAARISNPKELTYRFRNAEDAMMFKLVWMK